MIKRTDALLEIVDILNKAPNSVVNSYVADCILMKLEEMMVLPYYRDGEHLVDVKSYINEEFCWGKDD